MHYINKKGIPTGMPFLFQPAAIYARSICSLSGRIFCESSLSRLLPSPAGSPLNGDSLFPGTPVG